jgi:hypothetical protein
MKVIIGVFDDYAGASAAIAQLKAAGFAEESISLLGKNTDELRPVATEVASHKPDKLMTNFSIAGAIGGLLVGLATIAIPGTGALLVGGPLVAAVSGAAAGGALGVIAGALVHFDVPEYEAQVYEAHLTAGKVLVAVHTDNPDERFKAEQIFDTNGAIEVDTKAA